MSKPDDDAKERNKRPPKGRPLMRARMSHADLVAVSAVIIAFLALGISYWQLGVQRDHNRLSTRPALVMQSQLNEGEEKKSEFAITLVNVGLGPAEVESLEIYFDAQPVEDWRAFVEKLRKLHSELANLKYVPPCVPRKDGGGGFDPGDGFGSGFGAGGGCGELWYLPSPGQQELKLAFDKASPFQLAISQLPRFLGVGQNVRLYAVRTLVPRNPRNYVWVIMEASRAKLALKIRYKSLYGERFEACFPKHDCTQMPTNSRIKLKVEKK